MNRALTEIYVGIKQPSSDSAKDSMRSLGYIKLLIDSAA